MSSSCAVGWTVAATEGKKTTMVNVSVKTAGIASEPSQTYTGALSIVTTLFFMWGFLTCLNDILVPHLK